MKRVLVAAVVIAALSAGAAPKAAAQDLRFEHHYGLTFGAGLGAGQFTTTCDSGCPGYQLNANNVVFNAGYHFGPRLQLDLSAQLLSATGDAGSGSHVGSLSAGVALYLIPNLFVRGGVSQLTVSQADSAGTVNGGTTDGKGGPGFMAGAGYDLFLGRRFALTAYVNYFAGSISDLERTGPLFTGTTAGKLTALNFGISGSYHRGSWQCITASGERIRVTPNNAAATRCLAEVERRIGQPTNIK